jgi:hypothetical protein
MTQLEHIKKETSLMKLGLDSTMELDEDEYNAEVVQGEEGSQVQQMVAKLTPMFDQVAVMSVGENDIYLFLITYF